MESSRPNSTAPPIMLFTLHSGPTFYDAHYLGLSIGVFLSCRLHSPAWLSTSGMIRHLEDHRVRKHEEVTTQRLVLFLVSMSVRIVDQAPTHA
jgi:hypothetical protein